MKHHPIPHSRDTGPGALAERGHTRTSDDTAPRPADPERRARRGVSLEELLRRKRELEEHLQKDPDARELRRQLSTIDQAIDDATGQKTLF